MVERADALCLRHYARLGPVDRELRLAAAEAHETAKAISLSECTPALSER